MAISSERVHGRRAKRRTLKVWNVMLILFLAFGFVLASWSLLEHMYGNPFDHPGPELRGIGSASDVQVLDSGNLTDKVPLIAIVVNKQQFAQVEVIVDVSEKSRKNLSGVVMPFTQAEPLLTGDQKWDIFLSTVRMHRALVYVMPMP